MGYLRKILINLFSMEEPYKTDSVALDNKPNAIIAKPDTILMSMMFKFFEITDLPDAVGLLNHQDYFLNTLQ